MADRHFNFKIHINEFNTVQYDIKEDDAMTFIMLFYFIGGFVRRQKILNWL